MPPEGSIVAGIQFWFDIGFLEATVHKILTEHIHAPDEPFSILNTP